jgi:phage recombination protein Bet
MNAVAKPQRASKPTDVVTWEPPRLPWHESIGERFGELGVTKATWKVLCEAIWPAATTPNSIVMALSYCQSRRLDPFKKVVHIVPVWDSNKGGYVETVWPSISEMRTTAFRTGQYAGCDETKFGPDVTRAFSGKVKRDGKWVDESKTVTFPEWSQITVYRLIGGQRVPFVGPRVYWLETYARMGRSEIPNDMWTKRTRGQIEKCAEAGALRKAFPEELGNEYAAEEMEGQRYFHEMRDVTPPKPAVAHPETFDIPELGDEAAPPVPAIAEKKTAQAPHAKPVDDDMPPDEATPTDDDGWPGPQPAKAVRK